MLFVLQMVVENKFFIKMAGKLIYCKFWCPLFHSAICIVLDLSFCVMKALIALNQHFVFTAALTIKW